MCRRCDCSPDKNASQGSLGKENEPKEPDSSPMGKRRICCQSGCNRNRVEKQFSQFQSYIYIYYVSEEVHEDKEAAKEFLKSRRKEKKE